MARAEARTDGQSSDAISLHRGGGGAQQQVGDFGHGADDNYGLLAQGYAPGNNGRGTADGRRILDRCAAKLHYEQTHAPP
jgi:hypothetical protein